MVEETAELSGTLKELEDTLLYELANSTGNILDNTTLIETLQQTKVKAGEISAKLEEAKVKIVAEQAALGKRMFSGTGISMQARTRAPMRIDRVEPASWADRSGIRAGDRVALFPPIVRRELSDAVFIRVASNRAP